MKKVLFSLIVITILFSACKKDDEENGEKGLVVKKEQWALALNYTATWCGPCGSWGAPLIMQLGSMDKVLAVKAHASNDPMNNSAYYSSFTAERPSNGIPSFWINDEKVTAQNAVNKVNEAIALPVHAGLAMEADRVGTQYNVKVKAEWFEAGAGSYYLSVFLLENGIDGSASAGAYSQNGVNDPDYEHYYVFRTVATQNLYGEPLATDPAAEYSVEKEYTIDIDPTWTNDVYPVAVLWNYVGTGERPNYKFVNAIK